MRPAVYRRVQNSRYNATADYKFQPVMHTLAALALTVVIFYIASPSFGAIGLAITFCTWVAGGFVGFVKVIKLLRAILIIAVIGVVLFCNYQYYIAGGF